MTRNTFVLKIQRELCLPKSFRTFEKRACLLLLFASFVFVWDIYLISKTIQIILLKTKVLHKQNMKKKLRPSLNETKSHIPPVLYDFHV